MTLARTVTTVKKYLSGVERGQSENNFDAQGDQNGSLTDG